MDRPIKVLMVDDDPAFVESIRDLLEAFGYEVEAAFNGADGVARARAFRPDVMILDVMMRTETEGFEAARAVRDIPELQSMGLVLVTGVTATLDQAGARIDSAITDVTAPCCATPGSVPTACRTTCTSSR